MKMHTDEKGKAIDLTMTITPMVKAAKPSKHVRGRQYDANKFNS